MEICPICLSNKWCGHRQVRPDAAPEPSKHNHAWCLECRRIEVELAQAKADLVEEKARHQRTDDRWMELGAKYEAELDKVKERAVQIERDTIERCAKFVEDDVKRGGTANRYELAAALRARAQSLARPVAPDASEPFGPERHYGCGCPRDELRNAATVGQEAVAWIKGEPPHPYNKEWFIALTTFGDKVVLTALPEEYTYDYKTADDTYIKADKIKCWMQFPDSEFMPYTAPVAQSEDAERYRQALIEIAEHYTDTDLAAKHMSACARATLSPTGNSQDYVWRKDAAMQAGKQERGQV